MFDSLDISSQYQWHKYKLHNYYPTSVVVSSYVKSKYCIQLLCVYYTSCCFFFNYLHWNVRCNQTELSKVTMWKCLLARSMVYAVIAYSNRVYNCNVLPPLYLTQRTSRALIVSSTFSHSSIWFSYAQRVFFLTVKHLLWHRHSCMTNGCVASSKLLHVCYFSVFLIY